MNSLEAVLRIHKLIPFSGKDKYSRRVFWSLENILDEPYQMLTSSK